MRVSWVVVFLCASVGGSNGGLVEFPDFWYLETFNAAAEDHSDPDHDHSHLLVLTDDRPLVTAVDLASDTLRLRAASDDEAQRFEDTIQPIVQVSHQRRVTGPRVTSQRGVATPREDKRHAANEIRRMVNKFVVSATEDRVPELADALEEERNPTVTIYFKGDYSVISIVCERQVWNFVIRPPSPLPHWFYCDHSSSVGTSPAVDVPEDVQKEFYVTLLRLLKVFLRFDLL